jgi:acetyl-CoA carboxylase biotin carboxyl carrier protein
MAVPGPVPGGPQGGDVPVEVRAEMVANVGEVVVTAGDAVGIGDTLVVLESMKMEIPVLAEAPGAVAEVRVAVGDVVQEGDVLVVLSS